MAGFSALIIVFTSVLCQLPVTATSGALKDVVGAHGGSVTFTLNSTENQVDTVIWTFNTVSVAIVTRDHFKVLQNHNKKRIVFPDGIHSMKLSHLKKNDSGVYRAEIHNTSLQSPFSQEFVLCVYESLSTPKVTMDGQDKNGTCMTKLTCSMEEGRDNVTYSWRAIGQGVNEFHHGAILPIFWKLGDKDKTLICIARNPISHSSSDPVLARNLCEDTANNLSSSRFILYTIPVAIGLGVLLVIILFAMWTEKGKGKGSGRGRSKHTLLHCADPQSGEESQLLAYNATYTKAIKL
ncbi:SLAM family member 7 isoform X2 [Mesocricetus auratus]|uniref:SLAM family member 7 isoform X2 n=1 Tax=Mesocricetus auratus TaxID=10036 RepID=A0A3Q0D2S6_MESAU|nr:SLAM family member 7 isoform X2 [Mesocricetus auratus]